MDLSISGGEDGIFHPPLFMASSYEKHSWFCRRLPSVQTLGCGPDPPTAAPILTATGVTLTPPPYPLSLSPPAPLSSCRHATLLPPIAPHAYCCRSAATVARPPKRRPVPPPARSPRELPIFRAPGVGSSSPPHLPLPGIFLGFIGKPLFPEHVGFP